MSQLKIVKNFVLTTISPMRVSRMGMSASVVERFQQNLFQFPNVIRSVRVIIHKLVVEAGQ